MSAPKEYTVKRRHSGDRDYYPGDTRTARPEEVAHLVPLTLTELKAAKAPKNKAARAPKNKSA